MTTTTTTTNAREIAHALHLRESRFTGQRNWTRAATILTLSDGRKFSTANDHEEALEMARRAGAIVSHVYCDGAELKRQQENSRAATAEIRDRFDSYTDVLHCYLMTFANGSPACFVNDLDDAKAITKAATGAARVIQTARDSTGAFHFNNGRGEWLATVRTVNALHYIEDTKGARLPD